MSVQFITTPKGEELAVLPRDEFELLVDGEVARTAAGALASGEEETLSGEELRALLDAPTPLSFWRGKRGIRAEDAAAHLGLAVAELTDIEAGRRIAPLIFYRDAARLLHVTLDDLAA